MKRFRFWHTWLLVVVAVIIAFGVVMAFFIGTALLDLFNQRIDPSFWSMEKIPTEALAFRSWAYGALGGTIAGWGVTLLLVVLFPLKRGEGWAWIAAALGIILWYMLDTAISLYHRVRGCRLKIRSPTMT